jgi:hypothetical protein
VLIDETHRLSGFRFRPLHALGLLALGVLVWVPASMLVMPGRSFHGPLPPPTDAERAVAQRLEAHVEVLAAQIGDRRIGAGDSLQRASDYLVSVLQPVGAGAGARIWKEDVAVQGGRAENIIVDLAGASAAPVVLVGAHYDTAPGTHGANDNASGVAALLELTRRFAANPLRRPLRLVFFANEEPPFFQEAGMGSTAHADNTHARGETIAAMLSLETIGYYTDRPDTQDYPWPLSVLYPTTGNFIAFVGNWASRSLVRNALHSFRAKTSFPSEGAALPEVVPGVGWSDQWSFWRHDVPAIMITDTAVYRDPNYHTGTDRPSNIQFPLLARVVIGLEQVIRGEL